MTRTILKGRLAGEDEDDCQQEITTLASEHPHHIQETETRTEKGDDNVPEWR